MTDFQSIKNGDHHAFEKIFREFYPPLCGYAYNFLKEQEASEEVVQEVFFKIWERRNELDISVSVKNYLFRAVRNSSLNQLKHLKIKEEYGKYNRSVIRENEKILSDAVVEHELQEKIITAIENMPDKQKRVFILSRYEGLKYKEIAAQLGLSIRTVEVHISNALRYMREELSDYLMP